MSIYNIIGYILVSLPFIGLFIFAVKMDGWKMALSSSGLFVIILIIITAGAYLITLK